MGLFPSYIEQNAVIKEEKIKPIPKEYEIDFATGQLTGRTVEGKEAIKVWIWLALHTKRYRHYIYTWDYGCELEDLIGQSYTAEYTDAEARRMTEDCILVNRNIQRISDFSVEMADGIPTVNFTADTIYGKINFSEKIAKTP